jgi:histidine triad (HIT) family protein
MADDAEMEKLKNMSPEELLEYQKKNCVFCYIKEGRVPAKKVYEDDKVFAILDKNPGVEGHILLLPKEHYSIMPQLPADILEHFFTVAQSLAKSQLKAYGAQGVIILAANGAVAGQRAPHFMVHLIPRRENDGIDMKLPQNKLSNEVKTQVHTLIAPKIKAILGYALPPQTAPPAKKDAEEKNTHDDKEEETESKSDEKHDADKHGTKDTEEKSEKKDENQADKDTQNDGSQEDTSEDEAEEEQANFLNKIGSIAKGWKL